MLYLLRANGRDQALELATEAYVDPQTNQLICVDDQGTIIRRFRQLEIMAFSKKPFPHSLSR
jgi:hypothetical protein